MQFSKLKKQAYTFLAPSLQNRIAIHAAVYRNSHDQQGRTWLTFDGMQILSAEDLVYYREKTERYRMRKKMLPQRPSLFDKNFYKTDWYIASQQLYQSIEQQMNLEGIFDSYHVQQGLLCYNTLTIEEALQHDHPFVRGYALLDRRLGKRRLAKLTARQSTFEQRCLEIRIQAEKEWEG